MQWLKEGVELHAGPKYEMRSQGAMRELLIHQLEAKDTGEYACVTGGQKTTASLRVTGEWWSLPEERVSPSLPSHPLMVAFWVHLSPLLSRCLPPHPRTSQGPCQGSPREPGQQGNRLQPLKPTPEAGARVRC